MAGPTGSVDEIQNMADALEGLTGSLGAATEATSQGSQELSSMQQSLRSLYQEMKKGAKVIWDDWLGPLKSITVGAFGFHEIKKQFNDLANASTEYARTIGPLNDSVQNLTNDFKNLSSESAYYSQISTMRIVPALLNQSQGMGDVSDRAIGLAQDLKQLYITTDAATQAAGSYNQTLREMPLFIDNIRSESVNAERAVGQMLSATITGGADAGSMMEHLRDQIGLLTTHELPAHVQAARDLNRMWDNFQERMADVTIRLAEAFGSDSFMDAAKTILEDVANLAIKAADAFSKWVSMGGWDRLVGSIKSIWEAIKPIVDVAVAHPQLMLGLFAAGKIGGPMGGMAGGGIAGSAFGPAGTALGAAGGMGGQMFLGSQMGRNMLLQGGTRLLAGGVGATLAAGGIGAIAGGLVGNEAGKMSAQAGGGVGTHATGLLAAIGTGAGTGAIAGSIIPGAGTAAGAVIGGAVGLGGYLYGYFSESSKMADELSKKLDQLQNSYSNMEVTAEEHAEALERMGYTSNAEALNALQKEGKSIEEAKAELREKEMEQVKKIREEEAERLKEVMKQYEIIQAQIELEENRIQAMQQQIALMQTQYSLAQDITMNIGQMRESMGAQISLIDDQIQANQYILSTQQEALRARKEDLKQTDDQLTQTRIRRDIEGINASIAGKQAEIEALRLERVQKTVQVIQDELALKKEILGVMEDTLQSRMTYMESFGQGIELTVQQRREYTGRLRNIVDLQKQAVAEARRQVEEADTDEELMRARMNLQTEQNELLRKESEWRSAVNEQIRAHYESFSRYSNLAQDTLEAEFEYRSAINAGLSYSTEERFKNIKAQEQILNLEIQRAQQQVQMAKLEYQRTGDIENLAIAQETLNQKTRDRAKFIQREVQEITGYYDALSNALKIQVDLAESNLELMEKANLGLGVNISQRMKVYSLEKATLDARQQEINNMIQQAQAMADSRAKQEIMLRLQQEQASVTREQAGLIDKMKISMEDYIDAFDATVVGSTEAYAKISKPLQEFHRLRQDLLGEAGTVRFGMTSANLAATQREAQMGNIRAQFQAGAFARQHQLAGGGAGIPFGMLNIGGALGQYGAGGGLPVGVAHQYFGGAIGGPGWVTGGPGVQGIGPAASMLYPTGVTGLMKGQQILQNGPSAGGMVQYGQAAMQSAFGRNKYLPGVSPAPFAATAVSDAFAPHGGGPGMTIGGGGSQIIFNINAPNRQQIEGAIINKLREVMDPSGFTNRRR